MKKTFNITTSQNCRKKMFVMDAINTSKLVAFVRRNIFPSYFIEGNNELAFNTIESHMISKKIKRFALLLSIFVFGCLFVQAQTQDTLTIRGKIDAS